MKKKLQYIRPKQYHIIINDITSNIDKMVRDKRFTDKSFFNDEIKQTLEVLNFELLRSDKRMDKMMVYTIGIQLISMLIVQTSLFGRICIEKPQRVDGEDVPLITLPKGEVPMFMKSTISGGKIVDKQDLHSLQKMKEWYNKKFKNKSLTEIMSDGKEKRKRNPLPNL